MATLKNIIVSLLLATAVIAAPTAVEESSLSSPLVPRKNANKCEAHIYIDTPAVCFKASCSKYAIDLLDNQVPAQAMGYDWDWKNVGTWGATNPDYRIKIKTTKGPELWIDGVLDNVHGAEDAWRNSFTLHYGAQHWNGQDCKPLSKSARQSNGWRNQYDLWCEFDC